MLNLHTATLPKSIYGYWGCREANLTIKKLLKKLRVTLAVISIVLVTLLFVDFTGTAHAWFGWMAKIQFLPALLALNIGVLVALIVITLLLGRVYCSVICPLGIMQDIFAWFGKKAKKFRYTFSPAISWLRILFLGAMVAAVICGISAFVAIFAPYSAYGRIAQSLIAPVWASINNIFAGVAEHYNSYAVNSVDVWMRSGVVLGLAIVTLVVLGILAWRNGRTYCNTVCPVGTILGYLSKYSVFSPVIDKSKCNSCGLCSRNCKSACIDGKAHLIDYSRCVACMDCISTCRHGAISYGLRYGKKEEVASVGENISTGRRTFVVTALATATAAAVKAEEKIFDGGLAAIEDKVAPERATKIVPPGAVSLKNLAEHCTACQLCVASCPNGVLRPSADLDSFMQPYSSYERGYCRPECTRCSDACPTGAIKPIDVADKSSIQIGHAVWVKKNCVPLTDGVECGNCARHCPTGAILMIPSDAEDENSVKIPVVNTEKCIGCGACENLCPARPFSAIYVEGHETHRII